MNSIIERTNLIKEMIKRATEIEFDELTAPERFIYVLSRFGNYTNNDIFGIQGGQSSLNLHDIRDDISCPECEKIIGISAHDVPMILTFHENIANGIGSSFRPLRKIGIEYEKKGVIFTFTGIGEPQEYTTVPAKVKHHYEKKVKAETTCEECHKKLFGRAMKDANWEVDHKFSDEMDKYQNKSFRENPENYQLLCKSCNAAKRELERMRRNDV